MLSELWGGGWKANVNRDFATLLPAGSKISGEFNDTPRKDAELFQSVPVGKGITDQSSQSHMVSLINNT